MTQTTVNCRNCCYLNAGQRVSNEGHVGFHVGLLRLCQLFTETFALWHIPHAQNHVP